MEERVGWRGAIGAAWGNLTGVNEGGHVVRILFFLIFLSGTAWSIWSYTQALELIELEPRRATPGVNQAQADRARLDVMIQQVETTSQMRSISPVSVRIMEEALAKHPFREPTLDYAVAPPPPNGVIVIEPPVVFVDYPPQITLRGIMIMGNQHVAVMDISGVGSGMLVRAGDTFMQRRGRIVRIVPDRVVVNWGGRNWDIVPSF